MTISLQRFAARCWNISKRVPPAPNSTAKRKAAFNTVAPRVEVQAPAGLKARILKTAAQAENTPATARTTAPARPRRLWLRAVRADVERRSLIALVLLVFDPVGRYRAHAAGRIFRDAAAQLGKYNYNLQYFGRERSGAYFLCSLNFNDEARENYFLANKINAPEQYSYRQGFIHQQKKESFLSKVLYYEFIKD